MDASKRSSTWVLALTAVASLMVALDALVVTTALSAIRLDLHASIEELEWTVNAYALSFAVLLMSAAAIGDRFGRRRWFVAGIGLFTAASAACALAPGVGWLIVARAVQGAGAALVMPLALALLSAAFPPERRAAALGLFSGVTGLAVLGGPVVGGAITQGIAWEWIFWLNVPIGLVLAPLALRRMGESFGPPVRLDVPGLALVTGGALGLVWGLVRGNAAGWASAEVLGALGGGLALTAGFVAWERRAPEPMLPLGLFRARAFAAGNGAIFLTFASLFAAVFFLAQFLQSGLGHDALGAGLRLLPWTATLFFVAPVAAEKARRWNRLGGSIGAGDRRSHATKAASSTRPAASAPATSALVQPAALPRTSPHTTPNDAAVTSTTPGRSSRRDAPVLSGICASTSGAARRPIGTLSQKIHSHARPCATAPPITGPPATARPVRPCNAPIAAPRRSGGKAAPTRASASGITSAAPAPWTVRAATSQPADGASAQAPEARANKTSPAASSRRRPNRSPSAAALSSSTPRLRLYALTIHSSCSTPAPRSSRMVVSAVDTTSVSSATMKDARAARPRTHRCVWRELVMRGSTAAPARAHR